VLGEALRQRQWHVPNSTVAGIVRAGIAEHELFNRCPARSDHCWRLW
jgi:hypothetical protein